MSAFLGLDGHQWGGLLTIAVPVTIAHWGVGLVTVVLLFGVAHLANYVFREFG